VDMWITDSNVLKDRWWRERDDVLVGSVPRSPYVSQVTMVHVNHVNSHADATLACQCWPIWYIVVSREML
jgi:hypothetical protein